MPEAPSPPPDGNPFPDTDLANGRRFVDDHGPDVRYVADWKRWAVFDGRRWVVDHAGAVVAGMAHGTLKQWAVKAAWKVGEAAKALAAAGEADEAAEQAAMKALAAAKQELLWAKKSQDAKRIAAMLEVSRSAALVVEGSKLFDTHPHLLNCPNGTVDLRTGDLRSHRRDDFLTRLCPTWYDQFASAPTYNRFLDSVLPSPAVAGYVRGLSGLAVLGEFEQTLTIFHGKGSNGKGVLLDLWTEILGDGEYAATVPAELVADGGENRHPTEKTVLRGARLAVCQETDDGEALNAKRVKNLTGGSNITARGMRQDYYTFRPTHTLVLATNFLPRVRSNDHATWRRLRVVEFPRVFWTDADKAADPHGSYPAELKSDPTLRDRLRAEARGVLANMVANAVVYHENGRQLLTPAAVMRGVNDYRAREDVIGRFFAACVHPVNEGPGTPGGELYSRFRGWYSAEVDPDCRECPGSRTFGEAAGARFTSKISRGRVVYAVRVATPGGGDSGEGVSGNRVERLTRNGPKGINQESAHHPHHCHHSADQPADRGDTYDGDLLFNDNTDFPFGANA